MALGDVNIAVCETAAGEPPVLDLSLISAALIGLFSAVHCLGMCGGIMGALTFSLPAQTRQRSGHLLLFVAAFNLGRIASYVAAGALLGAVGETFYDVVNLPLAHYTLQMIAALLLAGIGLYLAGWFPKFALIEHIGVPIWRRLEPLGRRMVPVRSLPQALLYGMIWGWLPCGLVYTTLLMTLAAPSAQQGALFMLTFGLGTVPAVVSAGILTGWVTRLTRLPYLRPVVGSLLIVMAFASIAVPGLIGMTPPASQ